MAVYSTFFTCEFKNLGEGFPLWKPPLERATTRLVVNPFTQTKYSLSSRIPEWTDEETRAASMARPKVVAMRGDYRKYLEARLSPFVRSCPHRCSKGVLNEDVEELFALFLPEQEVALEVVLYAPPDQGACIYAIPDRLLRLLGESSPEQLNSLSVDGDLLDSVARPLAELAGLRASEQDVFLLVEP